MSEIETTIDPSDGIVEIRAYGGTRRERGAAIAATVRRWQRAGVTLTRFHTSYSEDYGFQTRTWTRYHSTTKGNQP